MIEKDISMSPIEGNRSAGSTLRLRDPSNSYKCYESIPTPSPISPDSSNASGSSGTSKTKESSIKKKKPHEGSIGSKKSLQRVASLDSLVNSSEQDSSDDELERLSDSDSLPEIGQITGETRVDVHRKSDLEEMKNVEPHQEPVIKAYLEKSHKKCDYKNCGFRRTEMNDFDIEDPITPAPLKTTSTCSSSSSSCGGTNGGCNGGGTGSAGGTMSSTTSSIKNRRNSIASSGSVGRMETILEEPIEPKVSVKEILARFETLREAAEVFYNFY